MAKNSSDDKLSFDTHLLDVYLTGLQAEVEAKAAKPAKKVAAKKSTAKPKPEATSKARAPVTAKTSPPKAAKAVAKKSAGKASG